MVCYVVVLNRNLILYIQCFVCRNCYDMFFKQTSAIHSPSHGCRLLLCDLTTVVIRLLSVGLEKEAGQGRTYSQDVGSSPIQRTQLGMRKRRMKHGFLVKENWQGTPLKFNMEPENHPLEKEIPIGNHHFEIPC